MLRAETRYWAVSMKSQLKMKEMTMFSVKDAALAAPGC